MAVHIIESGVVVNTIVAEVEDAARAFPQAVCIAASIGGAIGDFWDGESFIKPPPEPTPVPQAVTMRQARLALLSAGLLSSIDTTIASLPSPQKEAATIEWEYSQEVQRYNGLVSVLAPVLGLTEQQIDELFILAATL